MTVDPVRSKRGRAARARGNRTEVVVVNWLKNNGFPDAETTRNADRGRQSKRGDIDGIPGVVIEVKAVAGSSWPAWCRQALDEAARGRAWIVVRREPGVTDVAWWPSRWSPSALEMLARRPFGKGVTQDIIAAAMSRRPIPFAEALHELGVHPVDA